MRKVYHSESGTLGLIAALACATGMTVVLFGSLPFAHRIAKKETVDVRDITTAQQEEKPEELPEVEKPPEAEKPPEELKAPDLTDPTSQPLSMPSSLEVALGGGGGMVGLADLSALGGAQSLKGDDIFAVSDLEQRPELLTPVDPKYPPELERSKVEGSVTLLFVLNEQGRVEDPRVEASSRPEFEKPALEAIRKWRFRPGMKDGQAVRTYIRYPIQFRHSSG